MLQDFTFFSTVLGSQQNQEEGIAISHNSQPPASPITDAPPHHSGTFVTIDKPTLTPHSHPKSMVYITVYSWFFYQKCGQLV